MSKMRSALLLFVCALAGTNALIIPDEVPTLLSLIYSNIPTLKKGTDSRIGWGFRLGDRADFQVLVELGPQTNTQPLANQGGSSNKRNAVNNLSNTLWAQRQKEKNQISNTEGGKFLEQWSKDVSNPQPAKEILTESKGPTRIPLGVGEVDARDVIPEDSVLKLMELYQKKLSGKSTTTTQKPKTTTDYKDALDNVELE